MQGKETVGEGESAGDAFDLIFLRSPCRFCGEETFATMWKDAVLWPNAGPRLF